MQFVDTHSHIFYKDYDGDRDLVVKRATDEGVVAIFDVGLDIETNLTVIKNSQKYESVFPVAGFHPHEASHFDKALFGEFLAEHAASCVALGEVGLDYFRDHSPHDVQRHVFENLLELMLPYGKPLIFHSRSADDDMMSFLSGAGKGLRGVMHCFSGGPEFLEKTLALGLHISVGGPVTYPKNEILLEVIRTVPLNRLLFETDSPYLSPQAKRGKRNEPSYIPVMAEKIAKERGIEIEELAAATTANVKELFGSPVSDFLESVKG